MQLPLVSRLLAASPLVAAVRPLVDVSYQKYEGVALENGVTQWLGVRYAAPPIGDLRFAAPKDPVGNGSTVVADTVSGCCRLFASFTHLPARG